MTTQKYNIWFIVSLNVVILFITAMVMSVIPEQLPSIFGDVICTIPHNHSHAMCSYHREEYHIDWGYRHYLFFWMGVVLFMVQVIRIISLIKNHTEQ